MHVVIVVAEFPQVFASKCCLGCVDEASNRRVQRLNWRSRCGFIDETDSRGIQQILGEIFHFMKGFDISRGEVFRLYKQDCIR